MAAMRAGARTDVEHMVGETNGILVMFDHDHGIAEVAEPLQRIEQPRVVALMQADRGLVKHIEHAGQARTDLRRQTNALAFTA